MRVAVVTPYFRTQDNWLARCHASVRRQTHSCTHILVADGEPQSIVSSFEAQHIVLPERHGDYGDTPRMIGTLSAIDQGYDAVTFLDSDNWYGYRHIALLVKLHEKTGAAVCTSMYTLHDLEARLMAIYLGSDGNLHCDTNCMFLTKPAFGIVSEWGSIEPDMHAIGDRIIWYRIKSAGLTTAHTGIASVRYTAHHEGFYKDLGLPVPAGATPSAKALALAEANQKWVARGGPSLYVSHDYKPARLRGRFPEDEWVRHIARGGSLRVANRSTGRIALA